jgi:hypothetical protein
MRKRLVHIAVICTVFIIISSSFSLGTMIKISENNQIKSDFTSKGIIKQLKTLIKPVQSSIFTSQIQTICDDVEKTTEISFAASNQIDVDNNENTGINGKDITVQYLLLPWISFDPKFEIGLIFSVYIERIGQEIKNSEFIINAQIINGDLTVGYKSPSKENNEIPDSIRISTLVYISPQDNNKGLKFYISPEYSTGTSNKELEFISTYQDEESLREYSFTLIPSVETQISIESTRTLGVFSYLFTRDTNYPTTVVAGFKKTDEQGTKQTYVTISPLPQTMTFELGLTPFSQEGGHFYYESDTMYDISVIVESEELGTCKYAIIKNLPRYINADWIPTTLNGFYHIEIDSDGSDFYLIDSLSNPNTNLSIHGLEDIDTTVNWNFTNPGDFTVHKNQALQIDLDFIIGDWEARIDTEPVAENLKITWLIDVTGYLSYDTNWEPLNQIDILIKGSNLGIRTQAETFKAEDFQLDWTIWPPVDWNIQSTGEIDYFDIIIDIFINGAWYHLWPW